jgi:hypothetical protein
MGDDHRGAGIGSGALVSAVPADLRRDALCMVVRHAVRGCLVRQRPNRVRCRRTGNRSGYGKGDGAGQRSAHFRFAHFQSPEFHIASNEGNFGGNADAVTAGGLPFATRRRKETP